MSATRWRADILPGYSCTDLPLPADLLVAGEPASEIGGVLVRRERDRPSRLEGPQLEGPQFEGAPDEVPIDDGSTLAPSLEKGPAREVSLETGAEPTVSLEKGPAPTVSPDVPGGAGVDSAPQRPAVLYVHGWSDYFFQAHLGDFWAGLGYDFYAVDLRRYGRALRPGQLYGYITDLEDYAREIDAAVEVIRADGHERLVLMAHSTGGLTAALYADSHPGVFSAVVLNSPWLAMAGNRVLRQVVALIVAGVGRMAPTAVVPLSDPGFYRRSVLARENGEWDFDPEWKSSPQAQIRLGWGRAVIRGHERVAAGLHIDAPVLVLCSDHSYLGVVWSEEMTRADIVLDADAIAHHAVDLGRLVTVARIRDGLHDLVLSPLPVRAEVFRVIGTWVATYCEL